jgi:chromo domain-containing protein 1
VPENTSTEQQSTNNSRSQSPSINLTAARGKGATRGGHLACRNVFERREPPKKRRSPNETLSGPSKERKIFPTWSLRRKAELAGRSRADAAPDLAALGGLFDPSNPSSFKSLRPATLRQLSSNLAPQLSSERDPLQGVERSEDPVARKNSTTSNESADGPVSFVPSTLSRPAYDYALHGGNAICYFWHHKGSCSKGYTCGYAHSDDPTLPILPAPNKASKETTHADEVRTVLPKDASPPSSKRSINEICFFWHKAGTCTKGADCAFIHDNSVNFPVALDPTISRRDTSGYYSRGYDHWSDEENRATRNEKERRLSKDRYEPRTENQPPQYNSPPVLESSSTWAAGTDLPSRPQWNERDPFNSICYFWHISSTCVKGSGCKYIHSDQTDLPLAPQPNDKSSKSCKFWAKGDCYLGERCPYIHSPRIPELPTQVVSPTERRKSVSFATEDCGPELDKVDPAHSKAGRGPPPGDTERYDRTCVFRTTNNCHHGDACRYHHFYESERPAKTVEAIRDSRDQGANGDDELKSTKSLGDSDLASSVFAHSPLQIGDDPDNILPLDFDKSDVEMGEAMNTASGSKVTKLSIEDYRKKIDKLLNHRVKEVILGNKEAQSVVLDFGDIGDGAQHEWGQSFSKARKFHFSQMCTAQDFEALYSTLPRVVYWNGGLAANPADKVAMERMGTFSQYLRLCLGGLISVSEHFALLIYPAMDEWKVLSASGSFPPDDKLKYLIFQPSVDIKRIVLSKGDPPTLFRKTLVKGVHGLRYRQFLHAEKSDLVHHFYLVFPTQANHSAAFFASWLRASDSRCKIYSSQTEGAWNFFVKSREIHAGVILIHESVVDYVSELPRLYSLLNAPPNRMNTFWCISDSSQQYPVFQSLETPNLGQIAVTRIFPHGHMILLTPSFLVAEPEKACFFIQWFQGKLKTTSPGTWKIVCTHDIRTYLLQLALEKSLERDQFYEENHDKPAKDAMASKRGLSYQACEARFRCHEMISDLLKDSIQDRLLEPYDSEQSDSRSPFIFADASIDPDDEKLLITWFAGWAIRHLDKFRKYTVMGTNSSSCGKAVRIKDLMMERMLKTSKVSDSFSTNNSSVAAVLPENGTPTECFVNPEAENTSPVITDGKLKSDITPKHKSRLSMVSSPAQQVTPNSSRDLSSSPIPPLQFADGVVEMDTSPDLDGAIFTESRSVGPESTPDILLFCATTGCNVQAAREYLTNSNHNFQHAVRVFGSHNSKGHADQIDVDKNVLDMIASVKAEQTRQLPQVPRIMTGNGDRLGNAPFSANPPGRQQSPARGTLTGGNYSPTCNISPFSPTQLDCFDEQSPQSAKSNISSGFKPTNGMDMRLSSNRQKATREEEHGSRQGSTQSEIRGANGNRHFEGVLKSGAVGRETSRKGSNALYATQSPLDGKMDIDSPQESSRRGSLNTSAVDGGSGKEYRFESTTSWYRRLMVEGKGWEHIYVDAADSCFKMIGVK